MIMNHLPVLLWKARESRGSGFVNKKGGVKGRKLKIWSPFFPAPKMPLSRAELKARAMQRRTMGSFVGMTEVRVTGRRSRGHTQPGRAYSRPRVDSCPSSSEKSEASPRVSGATLCRKSTRSTTRLAASDRVKGDSELSGLGLEADADRVTSCLAGSLAATRPLFSRPRLIVQGLSQGKESCCKSVRLSKQVDAFSFEASG